MKKTVVSLLLLLIFLPTVMLADGYTELWNKVYEAAKKDLPKTQLEYLDRIIARAEADRDYGQLLKAEWRSLWTWYSVSPDSLRPQMARLEHKAAGYEASDPALAAVCYAALGKTCGGHVPGLPDADTLAQAYFRKAMASPAMLAGKKAAAFEPFVEKGRDAVLFDNDLLSLIGYTAGDYAAMHAWYATTSNRTATLLTALDMVRHEAEKSGSIRVSLYKGSRYVASLDSLVSLYSDLPACGEVAMAKYSFMHWCTDVTPAEKAAFLTESINRWASWPRIQELRNAYKSLTNPKFDGEIDNKVMLPYGRNMIRLKVRNISGLTLALTRLDTDGGERAVPDGDKGYKQLKAKAVKNTRKTFTRTYSGHEAYEEVTDSFVVSDLSAGVYLLEVTTDNSAVRPYRSLLYVTDMYVVHQPLPDGRVRVAVLSASTGQPVPGARLYFARNDNNKLNVTCGADGEALVSRAAVDGTMVRACTDDDTAMPFTDVWANITDRETERSRDVAALFTDRAIYRPGQTVHAAVICRHIDGWEQTAVQGKTVKLTLKDANYKTVAEKDVVTDDYGTASADFVLPQGGLTGRFSLRTDNALNGYVSFRVEEYKRPTFDVRFDSVTRKYENGDTLTVTGRAETYSGVAVQGAKVRYTVRRRQALWWLAGNSGAYLNEAADGVLAEGETVTGADGTFSVDVPMLLPVWEEGTGLTEDEYRRISRFYNIITEADVTDIAGETQNGRLSLPLGSKPVAFALRMPDKTLRDSLKTITFTLKNAAGNDIDGDVTYTVSGIGGTFTAKANVRTEITWNTAALLKSGRHTLTAVCGSDTVKHEFVVFGYDDTVPCIDTPDWFYASSDEFPRDGAPVYMQFGSSCADVHVLYTVMTDDRLLKSGTIDLSNEVVTRKITYKDEYGMGLRVNLVWVKNGRSYSHNVVMLKPYPDKRLIMKWTTFRDRLTPGGQEEWTLSVTRPDGTPADARLLAAMYDASLDRLAPLSWSWNSYMYRYLPYTAWQTSVFGGISLYRTARLKLADVAPLDFGRIVAGRFDDGNAYGNVFMTSEESAVTGMVPMSRTASDAGLRIKGSAPVLQKQSAMMETDEAALATNASGVLNEPAVVSYAGEDAAETDGAAGVQLRENLNETAFFYPALQTDSAGNVSVKFTLPESVTTWRFMGFAHDRSMNYGQIEAEAVATKTVMVQPNMPRFVRVGDDARIAARIFNTSDKAVNGTVVMQLVDPETDDVVLETKKKFVVEADSVGNVAFDYSPESGRSLLVCKIFAEGRGFSDGEQHYLPVLSDEEQVTNTVPFTQHELGVRTIDLKQLFPKDGRDRKLTVEYTNNPAWLMIQALPYISNVRDDDAISLATAYYANSISAYIMNQSPRIKSVFDRWKLEAGGGSMMSGLEKNQELKNIVLDETPWVNDADMEAGQKQMLANYFDQSVLENRLAQTLDKLSRLQSSADGSWCWWPGMRYGSPSLTASIVETLVRLDKMIGSGSATKQMTDKGLKFLGDIVVKEVEDMKKSEKEGHPYVFVWDNAVRYLYICTLSGRKMSAEESAAADFLLGKLKTNNTGLSLYHKALMAVVMAGRGDMQLAREYVRSLDEYTVSSEEMGRYYDAPRAAYSWFDYKIPTQVAAIEAMRLVDADGYAGTVEEMKRWLLMQKRVQGWNTPINSVNAVYAFLEGGIGVLENRAEATISVDGRPLELPEATAGLGYVKTTVNGDKAGTFTVSKPSEGTSWGAVYARSVQKVSSVAPSSAGLSVTRELVDADGKPVTALRVGDRVRVRITIMADRDYDYVQVKDKRAACMEPVTQLSGYRNGCYCSAKDNATYYYFDRMAKGRHVIETEYYADRAGVYETGICTAVCAYSPEYSARTASLTVEVKD